MNASSSSSRQMFFGAIFSVWMSMILQKVCIAVGEKTYFFLLNRYYLQRRVFMEQSFILMLTTPSIVYSQDGEQDRPLCALKEPAWARGHGPNSTKYCLQKVSTEIISHLNEESSPVWQRTCRKKRATVQAGNVPVIHVHDIVLMCVIHIHYF